MMVQTFWGVEMLINVKSVTTATLLQHPNAMIFSQQRVCCSCCSRKQKILDAMKTYQGSCLRREKPMGTYHHIEAVLVGGVFRAGSGAVPEDND